MGNIVTERVDGTIIVDLDNDQDYDPRWFDHDQTVTNVTTCQGEEHARDTNGTLVLVRVDNEIHAERARRQTEQQLYSHLAELDKAAAELRMLIDKAEHRPGEADFTKLGVLLDGIAELSGSAGRCAESLRSIVVSAGYVDAKYPPYEW